uniref:WH2 domain-containing protein n=1 Tax=Globodera rostochiensis TaxID=31243 RepID=A0A914HS94_GLORO
MPGPAPPPPPPPPPTSLSNHSNTVAPQKTTGTRAMLLNEIHKGTRLKKTVTNDRSAPTVEGQIVGDGPSTGRVAASAATNQKGCTNVASKITRNECVPPAPKDSPVKRVPSTAVSGNLSTVVNHSASANETAANRSTRATAIENLQKSLSTTSTSAPPPLPAKLPKQKSVVAQPSKLPLSQQGQFQTLRPLKTQPNSNENKAPLRRAGSNEEIQKRPTAPPPSIMRRPDAPPPPPPPPVMARPVQMAPAVRDIEQLVTSDKSLARIDSSSPPLPPPRVSSYLESMEQRFHFVPITELPPPPKFIGFRKDYANSDVTK